MTNIPSKINYLDLKQTMKINYGIKAKFPQKAPSKEDSYCQRDLHQILSTLFYGS